MKSTTGSIFSILNLKSSFAVGTLHLILWEIVNDDSLITFWHNSCFLSFLSYLFWHGFCKMKTPNVLELIWKQLHPSHLSCNPFSSLLYLSRDSKIRTEHCVQFYERAHPFFIFFFLMLNNQFSISTITDVFREQYTLISKPLTWIFYKPLLHMPIFLHKLECINFPNINM